MIEVVRAEAGDLDVLSELLAEAFFDLPPSSWLIRDEDARRVIFPAYFRIHLAHGLEHGLVYTTPDWAGVAVWVTVSTEPPTPPDGYDQWLAAATAPWTSQFVIFDTTLETRHPIGKAHDHLALLGVRPGRQGRGIGSTLLAARHQELDALGLPAYLEASSRRNRKLYLRHGYEDLGRPITLPDGGPSLFPMWREPPTQTVSDTTRGVPEWHAGMSGVFRKPAVALADNANLDPLVNMTMQENCGSAATTWQAVMRPEINDDQER